MTLPHLGSVPFASMENFPLFLLHFLKFFVYFFWACSNFQFYPSPPPHHFSISTPLIMHNRTREQNGSEFCLSNGLQLKRWVGVTEPARGGSPLHGWKALQGQCWGGWYSAGSWYSVGGWYSLGGWYSAVGTQTFRMGSGKRTLNIYLVKALAKRPYPRWILRLWFKLCCSWVEEV